MRSLLTLTLLSAAMLSACSAPPSVMEMALTAADSSFAELLADLHHADVQALDAMEDRTFLPDHPRQDSVLQAHDLDTALYTELVASYTNDPDRLVAVYNRALDVASSR